MAEPALMAEVWRGDLVEGRHVGHAVIVDEDGGIVEAWGDPGRVIYPRSSAKMLQALPLVESGAAERAGLGPEELALACASHTGAQAHVSRVAAWLARLGLSEADLACGPQTPEDRAERHRLRAAGAAPGRLHNNCSGKHAGFLTLALESGGAAGYLGIDHPVQQAIKAAFEEVTGEQSPCWGIDGCSAPNHACTLLGFGRAMAKMAAPDRLPPARAEAARALVAAMAAHPLLIAGEGRICTEIGAALGGKAVIKTGAEGVFAAILPGRRLGIALKIDDGATRASEAAMAALLVRLGLFGRDDPLIARRAAAPVLSRNGELAGSVRAAEALF